MEQARLARSLAELQAALAEEAEKVKEGLAEAERWQTEHAQVAGHDLRSIKWEGGRKEVPAMAIVVRTASRISRSTPCSGSQEMALKDLEAASAARLESQVHNISGRLEEASRAAAGLSEELQESEQSHVRLSEEKQRGLLEAVEEQEEVLERLRGAQEALEKELGHSESLAEALETKEEEGAKHRKADANGCKWIDAESFSQPCMSIVDCRYTLPKTNIEAEHPCLKDHFRVRTSIFSFYASFRS